MTIRNAALVALLGSLVVACTTVAPPTSEAEQVAAKGDAGAEPDDAEAKPVAKKKVATKPAAATKTGAPAAPAKEPAPKEDNGGEDDDILTGGRTSSGGDCCYAGDYYACPSSAACFGGFDVRACQDTCDGDVDCILGCVDELDTAPPPKGCTKKTAPANIQCGN